MNSIQAFVAHSFDQDDAPPVRAFLEYLTNVSNLHPAFNWDHAEHAEPKNVAEKVLSLFQGKNLFIAICTKKELAVQRSAVSPCWYSNSRRTVKDTELVWKTSDWIIQEIGVAVGLGLNVMLLIEEGMKAPMELLGGLEFIKFQRNSPEKSFPKVLQMITALSGHAAVRSSPIDAEVKTEAPKSSDGDRKPSVDFEQFVPPEDWGFGEYKSAAVFAGFTQNEKALENLNDQFLKTKHATEENNLQIWSARLEYVRLFYGFGGNLKRLVELADRFPENDKIIEWLARIYEKYQEHEKAAIQYERAARVATELKEEVRLLGAAAISYQNDGKAEIAVDIMEKAKRLASNDRSVEENYLWVEKQMAELTKEDNIQIAVMERMLDIDPTDSSTRFLLAHKHSECGHDALAAWHYSHIPLSERSAGAWNNLGVALQQLELPGKSIAAYREAEKKEETLAMSNLANQFIEAGFIDEAKALCEQATKIPDYHKNIDTTKSRISDLLENESKQEVEKYDEAKMESAFYKALGRSLLLSDACDLNGEWTGPDCTLSFALNGSRFDAEGQYDLKISGIFKFLGSDVESSPWKIEYKGKISRGAIIGTVTRKEIKTEVAGQYTLSSATSLLSGAEEPTISLMAVQENCREIWVMEREKNKKGKMYKLYRK